MPSLETGEADATEGEYERLDNAALLREYTEAFDLTNRRVRQVAPEDWPRVEALVRAVARRLHGAGPPVPLWRAAPDDQVPLAVAVLRKAFDGTVDDVLRRAEKLLAEGEARDLHEAVRRAVETRRPRAVPGLNLWVLRFTGAWPKVEEALNGWTLQTDAGSLLASQRRPHRGNEATLAELLQRAADTALYEDALERAAARAEGKSPRPGCPSCGANVLPIAREYPDAPRAWPLTGIEPGYACDACGWLGTGPEPESRPPPPVDACLPM